MKRDLFFKISGWFKGWRDGGSKYQSVQNPLYSQRFSITENTEFLYPDDFSVTFASVKNNSNQYMGIMENTSESLMDIFNSFNEEVLTIKKERMEGACITKLHFDKNGLPLNVRTLNLQERTVFSLDEGYRLSFLINPGYPTERFIQWVQEDGKVMLTSMFSELDVPAENCRFLFTEGDDTCILTVTDVPQLVKDRYLDRMIILEIILEEGLSTFSISSKPFIILSPELKPVVEPTDMFFLEEDDMDRPPCKLVGADPDLQSNLYLNLRAHINNNSEWVSTEEMEVEVRFLDEKGNVFLTEVYKWSKTEGGKDYYINERIETALFDNHTNYRVVASFLGSDIAETRLFIGRNIESRGYEWSDLTVRTAHRRVAGGMQNIREMIGLESIKKELEKTVCYMKLMDARQKAGLPCTGKLMHMVMAGSPGTGKTTVARLMGNVFKEMGFLSKGHLVEANRESLTDCIIGGTEKKTRRMLDMAKGGVLFIDEAYSLKSDDNDDRDFGGRVIDTLMTELSNPDGDTLVILAGYSKEMDRLLRSNPGLASRFPVRIDFPDYTPDELMQIAKLFFKQNRYTLAEGTEERMMDVFNKAVMQENFGNGRFVNTFIQNSVLPMMGERLMQQIEQGGYDESVLTEILPQDVPDAGHVLSSMGMTEQKNRVVGFAR